MSIGTLADIRVKFRRLVGAATTAQITDERIDDYIDSFYLYDFPSEMRNLKLKDKYFFNTVQGRDTYPFDSEHYTTIEQPVYIAKRETKLFYDPWSFYGANFNWQQEEAFTTGDGTSGAYAGTLTSTPLLRSVTNNPIVQTNEATTNQYGVPQPSFQEIGISRIQNILITANTASSTLNVTDDGNGNLIGDCTAGAIDYQTGAITGLLFSDNVPSGNSIYCQYNPFQAAIPLAVLFYQNQFILRPVPNRGYTVEMQAYRRPSQALLHQVGGTGTPEVTEWWETLAFGAAKKFYEDALDPDGVMLMDKSLAERYAQNQTRAYAQLGKERVASIYAAGSAGFGINQFP